MFKYEFDQLKVHILGTEVVLDKIIFLRQVKRSCMRVMFEPQGLEVQ